MRCPHCEADTPDGAKFCIECGTPLTPRCPQCGADTRPRAKFCGECGTPLTAQSPAPPAAPPPSPLHYTPGYLAEKILTSKAALEGERKQVTVLFADLKGSMELLADRDPEEARQLLDPVLERMMDAVHHYEGTVNQVMGDGIMALFGAPLAHEDHAVRACYAALPCRRRIAGIAEEVRRHQGLAVQIRVGLNSGEVVVRAIGNDLHMDYTAVGQTTHLAARMEQLAMPGTYPADRRHAAPGRGLCAGQRPGAGAGEGAAGAGRGLRAVAGRAGAVAVAGGGGAGADALCGARYGAGAPAPGPGTRRGGARAGGGRRGGGGRGQVPLAVRVHPVAPHPRLVAAGEPFRVLWQGDRLPAGPRPAQGLLPDRTPGRRPPPAREGHGQAADARPGPGADAAGLLALLEVPVEDPQWQAFDPPQRRRRTLEAIKHLLLRESQVQPLCLMFEDLHWIDAETQALLDSLVESLPTARLLLLVNYRPEYQHGWGSKTYYTQLRLDPLPPASADEFLQALLGDDPSLAPLNSS